MQPAPTKLSAADKARIEREAAAIVQKALLHIKIYHPFYGALCERLKVKQDWRHPTMYTDAVVLGYSPVFVVQKSWAYILFVNVHEVTHCALGHPFRRKDRDPKDWNIAIDHVTNLALLKDPELKKLWDADPELSSEGLADPRFNGMAAEQVYAIVHAERRKKEEEARQREEQRKQSQPQPKQGEESPEEQQSQQGSDEPEGEGKGAQGDEGEGDDLGESATGAPGDCLDAGASGEEPEGDEDESDSEEEKDGDEEGEKSEREGEASPEGDEGGDSPGDDDDGDEADEADDDSDSDDADDDDGDDSESDGERGTGGGGQNIDSPPERNGGLDESQVAELEREWAQAVMTAQLAACGDIESSMARAIGQSQESPRSFKECVDDFAHAQCSMEESWQRPNRRYGDSYLPSRCAPGVKSMVLGIDTSGSINANALSLMQRAAQGVLDDFGLKAMHVVYCDSRIRGTREFVAGDQVSLDDAKGGGGTLFHPVLRYALELEQSGEDVAGVIYLTDLDGLVSDPEDFAHIPTLWVDIVAHRARWNPAEAPAGLGSVINVHQ